LISPYVRRLRLAAELRALRAEAGLTHEQLAGKIGQSRAQISRLENGHVVDLNDVMTILEVVGIEGDRWTDIMTIAREAGARGWWESNRAMGERQARCADLEAGAKTIREFQMTFVPGLLQTPQFTLARAEADRLSGPVDYQPDKVVEARLGRQRMLRRPGGPNYEVIIDEVAVRRRAAPAEVVKEQLYTMTATVNGSPKISVRVLPVTAEIGDYAVPRSTFSIYTFADPLDPAVVTVDTITDDLVITELTEPDQVAMYDGLFDRLRAAAWSVGDSLDFLLGHAKAARR
jgi:transcriptional regulator with XRE-family HTH domain